PPQVGILALGRITDRLIPVAGQPAARPMPTATLSPDHRVADGAAGAPFLSELAAALTSPGILLACSPAPARRYACGPQSAPAASRNRCLSRDRDLGAGPQEPGKGPGLACHSALSPGGTRRPSDPNAPGLSGRARVCYRMARRYATLSGS